MDENETLKFKRLSARALLPIECSELLLLLHHAHDMVWGLEELEETVLELFLFGSAQFR